MTDYEFLIYTILLWVMAAACIFPGYRLSRGPSLADRAIAFDNIAINVAGILALLSIRLQDDIFVEAILVLALLGYLGTLSVARFMERGQIIVNDMDEDRRFRQTARERRQKRIEEERALEAKNGKIVETTASKAVETSVANQASEDAVPDDMRSSIYPGVTPSEADPGGDLAREIGDRSAEDDTEAAKGLQDPPLLNPPSLRESNLIPLTAVALFLLLSFLVSLPVALAIMGVSFMTLGSLGLYRMPDIYCRMHALSKATTLGVAGLLVALALERADPETAAKAGLAIFFLLLTIPVATHAIGRAAYLVGLNFYGSEPIDEWRLYGTALTSPLFKPKRVPKKQRQQQRRSGRKPRRSKPQIS